MTGCSHGCLWGGRDRVVAMLCAMDGPNGDAMTRPGGDESGDGLLWTSRQAVQDKVSWCGLPLMSYWAGIKRLEEQRVPLS